MILKMPYFAPIYHTLYKSVDRLRLCSVNPPSKDELVLIIEGDVVGILLADYFNYVTNEKLVTAASSVVHLENYVHHLGINLQLNNQIGLSRTLLQVIEQRMNLLQNDLIAIEESYLKNADILRTLGLSRSDEGVTVSILPSESLDSARYSITEPSGSKLDCQLADLSRVLNSNELQNPNIHRARDVHDRGSHWIFDGKCTWYYRHDFPGKRSNCIQSVMFRLGMVFAVAEVADIPSESQACMDFVGAAEVNYWDSIANDPLVGLPRYPCVGSTSDMMNIFEVMVDIRSSFTECPESVYKMIIDHLILYIESMRYIFQANTDRVHLSGLDESNICELRTLLNGRLMFNAFCEGVMFPSRGIGSA